MKKRMYVLPMLLVLAIMIGPASAATYQVTSGMANSQIQTIINGATAGDTINFENAVYSGIGLTVNKALYFNGNGSTLIGSNSSSSPIFTVSSSTGVSIKDFSINVNGSGKNGISGSNVYNCLIENNSLINGGDAININQLYANVTINNNTINNMKDSYGDGISLANHSTSTTGIDSWAPSTISNNKINDTVYGIFIGGSFKGNITGNSITSASAMGMQFKGKKAATNGRLKADITDNEIDGTPIGISMEHPYVIYLALNGNSINGTSYSIQTNSYFGYPSVHSIEVIDNYLGNTVSSAFQTATTSAYDNTGPGAYEK